MHCKTQFKIRASQIGRIMTDPRSKAAKENGELSETTKTYVKEYLTQIKYGIPKVIWSKEMEKGNIMEDDAISLYGLYKEDFYIKNESYFENDYITGTPDVITKDKIIDIKCPWDCYTFPAFETDIPNAMYYWQMQGYMSLTGKPEAEVVYCLMNTPLELQADFFDYTELPLDYRIKIFTVKRDQKAINKINERVKQINNWIENL